MRLHEPDLTRHPPRSPRVRLGGYVILPRLLDKGRASVAGKSGDYKYGCPLDQRFFAFAGIESDALKTELAKGKSDGEVLEWIEAKSKTQPSVTDIAAWSAWQEQRVPTEPDSRKFFNELHLESGPHRTDIATWFDLLDLDDYASFGGKP